MWQLVKKSIPQHSSCLINQINGEYFEAATDHIHTFQPHSETNHSVIQNQHNRQRKANAGKETKDIPQREPGHQQTILQASLEL